MKRTAVLFLTLVLMITQCGCAEGSRSKLPERPTLYLAEQRRIITVTREEYLIGCILSYAEPSFQQEALNAIGAACCGWAVCSAENGSAAASLGADLSDGGAFPDWTSPEDTAEELGSAWGDYRKKLAAAAEYAAEHCPEYNGAAAYTPVIRCSTGKTDSGGTPYLPAVELPCDPQSPHYSATCTVTAEYVRRALRPYTGSVVLPASPEDWFTKAEYTPGGVLTSVRFGEAVVKGEELQTALGLRSSAVSIVVLGEEMTFITAGCGSNIGLSAYSAERMARSGMSAEEILAYFFGEDLKTTSF